MRKNWKSFIEQHVQPLRGGGPMGPVPQLRQSSVGLGLMLAAGCAASQEAATVRALQATASRYAPATRASEPPELNGDLGAYVAYAMHQSPELRAAFNRWRAAVQRIAVARKLPEPVLTYQAFIQQVETRVGPQRHRLSIRQMFPWPTELMAAADAASLAAEARQRRFDALALAVKQKVAKRYWELWRLQRLHQIALDEERVLEALEHSVRARVEAGKASTSELLQVQLTLARHRDHHAAHAEAIRAQSAQLVAAIGASPGTRTPVKAPPPAGGLPKRDTAALLEEAARHPRLQRFASLAASNEAAARQAAAQRLPQFGVGFSWIETGQAPIETPESGKDPLLLSLSMTLPVWQGAYSNAQQAARADAEAQRAEQQAALRNIQALLQTASADLRDANRRIALYANTLLPQARFEFESVRGNYQVGRATIAELLLSERRRFELQNELARARVDHRLAKARLEALVGRDVRLTAEASSQMPEVPHDH